MGSVTGVPSHPSGPQRRWSDLVLEGMPRRRPELPPVLGVLEGEGIGPDVVQVALRVLAALEAAGVVRVELRHGGPIGRESERKHGTPLSEDVIGFCREVFSAGGAVLAGAGGGRFVYDLRREFDMFCKIVPLKPSPALHDAGRLKPEFRQDVDILLIRENTGGIYQGRWSEHAANGGRRAEHTFWYTEPQVTRILRVGARIAAQRRGEMTVVIKDSGIPSISNLWRSCALDVAKDLGVRQTLLDIDHAAYRIIQHAQEVDVLVAPNLFGDVLADIGALLLGSRGISYSGNYCPDGSAVYQTNHGGAYDLAGLDRANPCGQVLSLAMLLRESFGLEDIASLIEQSVEDVWRDGWRTFDLRHPDCRVVGTNQFGDLIVAALSRRIEQGNGRFGAPR